MGTKRYLAPLIAGVCERSRPGPMLDLFAGMCAVGSAVSPARQIWSNDAQLFASEVATAQFTSVSVAPNIQDLTVSLYPYFKLHLANLLARFEREIEVELISLQSADFVGLSDIFNEQTDRLREYVLAPATEFAVFIERYGGTYFSWIQAAEIDSIVFAIEALCSDSRLDADGRRWAKIALAIAMSRTGNVTGHFAQSLRPKESNIRKLISQRSRSIYREWLNALSGLSPVGSREWRTRNRVFHGDALDLLKKLKDFKTRPAIIYADPPYSKDQYSRYYNIYETLIKYDSPQVKGIGICRSDRFTSTFSLRSKVSKSLEDLVFSSQKIGSDLILSYPNSGLLKDSEDFLMDTFIRSYGKKAEIIKVPHRHSTMGGARGKASEPVWETVFRIAA